MTNVLQSARKIAKEREAAKQAEQSELLKQARQMAFAVATDTDVPDPSEIIKLVDRLKVPIDWFDDAVSRCYRRIADFEGQSRVPTLKQRAAELEREAQKLESEATRAQKVHNAFVDRIKNIDARVTLDFYRPDTTAEELAEKRKLYLAWVELCDRLWLAQRDAKLLRDEIRALEKIDHTLIDPTCGEPAPRDFKLPPLG